MNTDKELEQILGDFIEAVAYGTVSGDWRKTDTYQKIQALITRKQAEARIEGAKALREYIVELADRGAVDNWWTEQKMNDYIDEVTKELTK